MKTKDLNKEFAFLVQLRDSAVTNMWGAAPYLVHEFGLSQKEAKEVLLKWIASFEVGK
jgi:hypothetical protein